jgi:hypothetical protein
VWLATRSIEINRATCEAMSNLAGAWFIFSSFAPFKPMLACAGLNQVALVMHLVMSTWKCGPDWLRYLAIVVISVSSAITPALWLAVVSRFFGSSGDSVPAVGLVTCFLLHGLLAIPPVVLALVNCSRLLRGSTRSINRLQAERVTTPYDPACQKFVIIE